MTCAHCLEHLAWSHSEREHLAWSHSERECTHIYIISWLTPYSAGPLRGTPLPAAPGKLNRLTVTLRWVTVNYYTGAARTRRPAL